MKMCIQAVLDGAGALRHMNKNNSERPVCTTHPLAPISTSFLFVFDTEWVMSTCEHQGRDTVLHTCLKLHWSRHSASSCFNRVWNVTISSAKHQSMLRPWVMQHQPWPCPSAWTKTAWTWTLPAGVVPSLSSSQRSAQLTPHARSGGGPTSRPPADLKIHTTSYHVFRKGKPVV